MSVEKFQKSVEDIKKDKTRIINQAGHDLNRWMTKLGLKMAFTESDHNEGSAGYALARAYEAASIYVLKKYVRAGGR